jgi:hypothetical protein
MKTETNAVTIARKFKRSTYIILDVEGVKRFGIVRKNMPILFLTRWEWERQQELAEMKALS